MYLRVLVYCCLYYLTQGSVKVSRKFDYKVTRSIEIYDKEYASSQSEELPKPFPSNALFVQHPHGGQSFYLPPTVTDVNNKSVGRTVNLHSQNIQQENNKHHQNGSVLFTQPLAPLPVYLLPQYRVPPRKHYKIVLVRSPAAAPVPTPSAVPEVEEKTLIYVLVKKPDEPTKTQVQAIEEAQHSAFKLNKPEVYFIKYQTHKNNRSIESAAYDNNHQPLETDALNPQNLSASSESAAYDNNHQPLETDALNPQNLSASSI